MIRFRLDMLALAAAAAIGSGCASPPRHIELPQAATSLADGAIGAPFTVAPSILAGIDTATGRDDWQIGDRVLLGVRVTKPGADTVRLVLIELTDRLNPMPVFKYDVHPLGRPDASFQSGAVYTHITVFDADGRPIESADGRFPYALMGYGLFDGAGPFVDRPRLADGSYDNSGVTDEQAEREMYGWLTLFSFSSSLGHRGVFSDMMKDVVARPWLLSILLNPSIALKADGQAERRDWAAPGAAKLEGVDVPLSCAIADKVGAIAQVWAVEPVAPLGLCGGVISIAGRNADKPDVTFEVRLLAAKRGDKGRAFLPPAKFPPD